MGFNAALLIDLQHLREIASDPGFGARLAALMDHAAAPSPRTSNTHRLSDMEPEAPYDMEISAPFHANQMVPHEIIDGNLIRHGHRRAGKGANLQLMAARLSAMNYPRADHDAEEVEPEPYRRLALPDPTKGKLSLLVLFDAIHDIREDQTLGARLASGVLNYAAQAGALIMRHRQIPGLLDGIGIDSAISAGNHSNPITIIGLTAPEDYDLFVAGENFGMMLRPEGDVNHLLGGPVRQDRQRVLRKERLQMLQTMPAPEDEPGYEGPK